MCLPDEILASILSLLPLKEAQATSVLSRRWCHLWASTVTLNFDSAPTMWSFVHSSTSSKSYNLKSKVESEISRSVPWINSVVKQHNVPCIELFRVRSHLNQEFAGSIDKWIQFAMEKGVQTLELDFSIFGCIPPMYTFPHDLIKHLCDGHIPIQGPSACIGLKSLKVLNFHCVDVAGEVLEYYLSNCPVLERLLVRDSPSLSNLRVVDSSVALKYLLIEYCRNIKSIEICDTNLVSFIYDGDCRNLLLRNVPLLVEVSVSMPSCKDCIKVAFTQLSCRLSQLKILKLNHLGVSPSNCYVFVVLYFYGIILVPYSLFGFEKYTSKSQTFGIMSLHRR
ncbi:putative F-box domain, leucine-rich repeat domain, L domain-containing protein [Rosa chinensis]|uniref:Putative F-box domain, leucine-rich repeat domain, L domain-containing protein n=1 Tax=Rosa chinensis TaxID=74649 RepID=A0A2P6RBF2_ROSCH|nr:putative F-box domain, leucine-rich repeat domain, L domain-containing protein [Rosa chinensis]